MSDAMIMAQVMPQVIMERLGHFSDEEIALALGRANAACWRRSDVNPGRAIAATLQAYFLMLEQNRRIMADNEAYAKEKQDEND